MTKKGTGILSVLIVIAAAMTVAVGWVIPLWHLRVLHDTQLEHAGVEALGQSRILRAHAEQAFDGVTAAFRSLDQRPDLDGLQVDEDGAVVNLLLRQMREGSPLLDGVGLVDPQGMLRAGSGLHPPPAAIDLSDRDYFRFHRDDPSPRLLIGAPLVARVNNARSIPLSMRLSDEQGRFAGVVVARLLPSAFASLYGSSGADRVVLSLTDGTTLVSIDGPSGAAASGLPVVGLPAGGEGNADLIDSEGGRDWLIGYARSDRYPVLAAVGFDKEALLAEWRQSRVALLTTAAVRTLVVLLVAGLLLWWVWRQWRLSMALLAARDAANEARLSAEAANRSKSEFLAHMSHELRTPLNAVIGFSEMMASERIGPVGNPRYREYAQIVNSSSGHLLSVINSILDLAKVDAGKWDILPEFVTLSGLGRDLRNLAVGRAEASNVRLSIDLPEELPKLETDRRLLLQVLVNLVSNAIKFTPAGGLIEVRAQAMTEHIVVQVADTGYGMTAAELAAIREPYRHGNGQTRRQHETGLGLPLSLRFTELIGGRLDIESRPGEGTCATLHLPLRMPAVPE